MAIPIISTTVIDALQFCLFFKNACTTYCLEWHFSNLIVSSEEWKKELARCLIDYNSLDIENTIASGLSIHM